MRWHRWSSQAGCGARSLPRDAPQRPHVLPADRRRRGERDAAIEPLAELDIKAVFHYVPLHSAPAGRRFGRAAGPLPVTDETSDRLLRLPLWVEMTDDDIDYVVERAAPDGRGVSQVTSGVRAILSGRRFTSCGLTLSAASALAGSWLTSSARR